MHEMELNQKVGQKVKANLDLQKLLKKITKEKVFVMKYLNEEG
jgi:hypothetical protein